MHDRDAYAAELRKRWGGLLSYRYLGRTYAAMDIGPEDNTVTLRHDMRNATGGLIHFLTKRATESEFNGYVEAGVAEFGTTKCE